MEDNTPQGGRKDPRINQVKIIGGGDGEAFLTVTAVAQSMFKDTYATGMY